MQNQAAGCITAPANLLSPDLRQVWDAMNDGKDSAEAQARVKRQRDILARYPPFPPTLKALLHREHGLPRWSVRPPLEALPQELEEQVVQEFDELNF
jgi:dihydrodipicolinate synthase/N-acetylneuraminate lyase